MTDTITPIPAYVYKVTCKWSGEYYFGFRAANTQQGRLPQDDLWIHYFTSSKVIAALLKSFPSTDFSAEVIAEYLDPDAAYWAEQLIIEQHLTDPLCINKWFRRREDGRKVFHNLGAKIIRSPQAMENYRLAGLRKRGKKLKPRSDAYKKQQSIASTGRRHTQQTIEHLRIIKTGLPKKPESVKKQADKISGRPQAPEHVATRIEATKRTLNDPNRPILTCDTCGYQTQNKSVFTKGHGVNCKPKPVKPKKGDTTYTCTHCGLQTTNAVCMARWHNDKCKQAKLTCT